MSWALNSVGDNDNVGLSDAVTEGDGPDNVVEESDVMTGRPADSDVVALTDGVIKVVRAIEGVAGVGFVADVVGVIDGIADGKSV